VLAYYLCALDPEIGIGEDLEKIGLRNYACRRETQEKTSGYLVSGPRFETQTSLI
jgi:hypothetical protein